VQKRAEEARKKARSQSATGRPAAANPGREVRRLIATMKKALNRAPFFVGEGPRDVPRKRPQLRSGALLIGSI